MSEDAPVNTGAVAWPDDFTASVMVRRMQAKLHRWAIEDSDRRFGDLFNLVCDPAFLVTAWQRVSTNKGARTAGIDKATAAWIETSIGVVAFLNQIRDLLKSGGFRPDEVRQVLIPKGNSGKFRKLGIPTIADRVVQASLKLVLEPIFEADFKPCSYGFRPNRRAQDAIAEIHHFASESINYRWVFETDIKACFDEISHPALMGRLRVRIKDGCGSSEVSWLRCEDLAVLVFRVVDAFVLAAEVEAPVGVEVAGGNERAELQDGLGAFEAPSCARYVHSVLYDAPARTLDYPGGDGPAFLQRGGVVQVVLLVVQVAGALVGAGPSAGE